jgi:hypothetical protein
MESRTDDPLRPRVAGRGGRWRTRSGMAALAALTAASILAVSISMGHGDAHIDLMGVGDTGGAYTYMMNTMGQQQAASGQHYYPPGQQSAMDFAAPELAQQQQLVGMQPVPCSQSLAGCGGGGEAMNMANPAGAPNYNSGEGMTYMPSTQSGVSAQDQSPEISGKFLADEERSKKHMKKLAKLLKKSTKAQDELDVKVCHSSKYFQ